MGVVIKRVHSRKVCLVIGGMDVTKQSIELQRRPHIVIATPGRLADLLKVLCDAPCHWRVLVF